jgi:hypothetical protein
MQKRRGQQQASTLPVTQADVARNGKSSGLFGGNNNNSSTSNPIRRRKGTDAATKDLWGFQKLLLGIVATGFVVVFLLRHVMVEDRIEGMKLHNAMQDTDVDTDINAERAALELDPDAPQHKSLDTFPSLQYALQNSKLVGLYFGASWCKDTTPITALLQEHFGDVLLPPPAAGQEHVKLAQRYEGLSLVYVSSDKTEVAMRDYLKPNWMTLPFETNERADLKRRFVTCAKEEMKELDFIREHDIPTLIIVEGGSHHVLTYHGVRDVQEFGMEAMDNWMKLASFSDALDSK